MKLLKSLSNDLLWERWKAAFDEADNAYMDRIEEEIIRRMVVAKNEKNGRQRDERRPSHA